MKKHRILNLRPGIVQNLSRFIVMLSLFLIPFQMKINGSENKTDKTNKKVTSKNHIIRETSAPDDFFISPDSTLVMAILDGNIVSYSFAIKYCREEKKGKLTEWLSPKDAVFQYGDKGRNGVWVCETIKKQ
jgi:hypothetical protein